MIESGKSTPEIENEATPEERAGILRALDLTRRKPKGVCATEEEIAAYYDKLLTGRRQVEVESHVAHCDRCFAQWVQAVEAMHLIRESKTTAAIEPPVKGVAAKVSRMFSGRWPVLSAAAVVASAVVLALWILLPFHSESDLWQELDAGYAKLASAGVVAGVPQKWRWQEEELVFRGSRSQKQVPGSKEPTVANSARAAFTVGARLGLQEAGGSMPYWREIASSYPGELDQCGRNAGFSACQEKQDLFAMLGRWAVLVYFACEHAPDLTLEDDGERLSEDFWQTQVEQQTRFVFLARELVPRTPFMQLLEESEEVIDRNGNRKDRLCLSANQLLDLGLK